MKKKVYYKLNRYQVTKVEVETAEQEQAVKMLNREMDRFKKMPRILHLKRRLGFVYL